MLKPPALDSLLSKSLVRLPVGMGCRADGLDLVLQALEENHSFEGCLEKIRNLDPLGEKLVREKFVGNLKLALSYDHPELARLIQAVKEHEDKHPAIIDLADREWPMMVESTPDELKPKLFDASHQLRCNGQMFYYLYPALLTSTLDKLFINDPEGFSRAITSLAAEGESASAFMTRRYQSVVTVRHLHQDDVRRKAVWENQFPSMHVFEVRARFVQVVADLLYSQGDLANEAMDAFISITQPRGRRGEDEEFKKAFSQLSISTDRVFEFPLEGTKALNALIDYAESRGVEMADMVVSLLRANEKNGPFQHHGTHSQKWEAVNHTRKARDVMIELLELMPSYPVACTQQTEHTAWLNTFIRRISTDDWVRLRLNDDQLIKLYRNLGDNRFLAKMSSAERLEEALHHDLGI